MPFALFSSSKRLELLRLSICISYCLYTTLCRHRDGIRLRPSRHYDMRLESDGSVALVVSSASARRHAGVYTCTVTNEMGQVSSSARVTVKTPVAPATSDPDVMTTTPRYTVPSPSNFPPWKPITNLLNRRLRIDSNWKLVGMEASFPKNLNDKTCYHSLFRNHSSTKA